MKRRQQGFTLLEVLIAMALFSLLGLACYQLLERMMHTDRRIHQHELQLRRLQRAVGIFERDLTQAVAYPVDASSARQALIGEAERIQLVRSGWSNPQQQARSDLQLVSHRWSDGQWLREYRSPVNDPAQAGGAAQQLLLDGVRLERLRYIDAKGQAHANWPVGQAPLSLPQAIEVEFDAPGYPGLRRVILLPGFKGQDHD
ncbi:type II secretion system minor pseudopilin GspJ [Pseudomonas chlororaphis]|uniref:Type II secretion system protein J n=1 Tax=Pseudomonas chlororaphis TaxID=587753 RepID=A0A1Q8EJG8_9PSED|nr:type II secretion system minor pseudopilin GspJ [Pseudomonas chlororaphis]OLF51917.1 type II secretion system protein GspJ [Pseudomonas chlororaphis]